MCIRDRSQTSHVRASRPVTELSNHLQRCFYLNATFQESFSWMVLAGTVILHNKAIPVKRGTARTVGTIFFNVFSIVQHAMQNKTLKFQQKINISDVLICAD